MACWWAARRSIPRAGPSLCRPAWHRYYLPRMYGFLVGILILDSLVLAAAVLLQAGQGGGLASLGGGAGTEQFLGGRPATSLRTHLHRCAGGIVQFLSLVLAIMSAQARAPRSVIDTSAPPPAPVLPTPLPLQSTPPAAPPAPPSNPSSGRRPPDR